MQPMSQTAPRALERARYKVITLLILLFAVTYLDRVCISVAGPRMQKDLHIDPHGWGWVTGVFTLSYCLFELPTGAMGDRLGPRRVLTRIVLWWSLFTALTGAVTRFPVLLATRFLFGAGEAGAFPNAGVVVSRWFPASQRAMLSGINLMASQIGGALSPLLVVPIQMRWGWRASFFAFGALGVLWAATWFAWFRDTPAQRLGTSEPTETPAAASTPTAHAFPLQGVLRSRSVLGLLVIGFCYVYVYNFFQSWFHTFLVNGRGFTEGALGLSALPYIIGACSNLAGGAVSDALVGRLGRKNGRRIIGVSALATAAVFVLATALTRQGMLTVVLLGIVYGAITFQQSVAFAVCLDLGHDRAGAMVGLFNMICQVGGLVGSVAYGYIVTAFASFDAPFWPMAAVLFIGAAVWWRIDASENAAGTVVLANATARV
jgi:MFS transporter, ACS family, glucarate transporter